MTYCFVPHSSFRAGVRNENQIENLNNTLRRVVGKRTSSCSNHSKNGMNSCLIGDSLGIPLTKTEFIPFFQIDHKRSKDKYLTGTLNQVLIAEGMQNGFRGVNNFSNQSETNL